VKLGLRPRLPPPPPPPSPVGFPPCACRRCRCTRPRDAAAGACSRRGRVQVHRPAVVLAEGKLLIFIYPRNRAPCSTKAAKTWAPPARVGWHGSLALHSSEDNGPCGSVSPRCRVRRVTWKCQSGQKCEQGLIKPPPRIPWSPAVSREKSRFERSHAWGRSIPFARLMDQSMDECKALARNLYYVIRNWHTFDICHRTSRHAWRNIWKRISGALLCAIMLSRIYDCRD